MASKPTTQTPVTSVKPTMTAADIYKTHFAEYPDVLNVIQVSEVLGVSTKTVYGLLNNSKLLYLPVGREKRVPKLYLLQYLKLLDHNSEIE